MDISSVIKNINANVLNEETATEIAEAFENAVNEKVNAKVELQIESALGKQDEEHAHKLDSLLKAIDEDHSSKLNKVVDAINENHTTKLKSLSNFYRKALNEKAEKFTTKVVDRLNVYLENYLDKSIPAEQLEEAVANTTARKQLEQIKSIISFDPSCLNEEVKQLISQGKEKVNSLHNQLSESYKENIDLRNTIADLKSKLMLENKTKGMSSSKKGYITNLLSDKSPEYIEENFKYVVEMFEREDSDSSSKLVEEATKKSFSKNVKVPAKEIISESNKNVETNNPVNKYLTALQDIR
jgi:hypothetical protein